MDGFCVQNLPSSIPKVDQLLFKQKRKKKKITTKYTESTDNENSFHLTKPLQYASAVWNATHPHTNS